MTVFLYPKQKRRFWNTKSKLFFYMATCVGEGLGVRLDLIGCCTRLNPIGKGGMGSDLGGQG